MREYLVQEFEPVIVQHYKYMHDKFIYKIRFIDGKIFGIDIDKHETTMRLDKHDLNNTNELIKVLGHDFNNHDAIYDKMSSYCYKLLDK